VPLIILGPLFFVFGAVFLLLGDSRLIEVGYQLLCNFFDFFYGHVVCEAWTVFFITFWLD